MTSIFPQYFTNEERSEGLKSALKSWSKKLWISDGITEKIFAAANEILLKEIGEHSPGYLEKAEKQAKERKARHKKEAELRRRWWTEKPIGITLDDYLRDNL